mmetsp:Transcript_11864/g.32656  ORF Transcript_11864/g.32656 Transcript_11864/m.32656 type:complete len:105 (-) Transcript_11864:185-499(-)
MERTNDNRVVDVEDCGSIALPPTCLEYELRMYMEYDGRVIYLPSSSASTTEEKIHWSDRRPFNRTSLLIDGNQGSSRRENLNTQTNKDINDHPPIVPTEERPGA